MTYFLEEFFVLLITLSIGLFTVGMLNLLRNVLDTSMIGLAVGICGLCILLI